MTAVPELESVAHARRTSALATRLGVMKEPEARELCGLLDAAVEFAACEGKSVAEAIREFFEETEFLDGPARKAQQGLRRLAIPSHLFPVSRLPVMPRAASRLLRTTDEHTSAAELEQIAGSDPALAAGMLSAANSARFGSRFQINRLRDAVLRVGVPEARKILLSGCFSGLFASKTLQDLWEHSQNVADTAFQLAGMSAVDPELAYVAGLLHDIGRLAFATFPPALRVAEQQWIEAGFPLVYAESLVYGKDHAEFGAELLREWDLPGGIADAVAMHHRPECSQSRLNAALHLAESLTAPVPQSVPEDLWSRMRRTAALAVTGSGMERSA